jgi:transcriptional activator of cad operon
MDSSTAPTLHIGDWRVEPVSGQISRNGETLRLDVRAMRVLLYLAHHAGEVVSIDDLIAHGWDGVLVSSDSVYQTVASLRRQLGDDSRKPSYIETAPRLGYRMIAAVSEWRDTTAAPEPVELTEPIGPSEKKAVGASKWVSRVAWGIGVVALAAVATLLSHARFGGADHSNNSSPTPPQLSIAVLPLLDLTEGMHSEEFADGMTEELIDKISKVSGFRVSTATASFYYKGKQASIAEIAQALRVTYILDGSVRKSGRQLRVAARLVRADSGYVIWSETYDRPLDDILMVQDDIAGEVTKSLRASMPAKDPK